MGDPEKFLWKTTTAHLKETRNVFYHLMKLQYADKPDYKYIRMQLMNLLQIEETKLGITNTNTTPLVIEILIRLYRKGKDLLNLAQI